MRSPSDATPGELQALPPVPLCSLASTGGGLSIQRAGQDDKELKMRREHFLDL